MQPVSASRPKSRLLPFVLFVFAVICVAKLAIAAQLDLFSDEIFYWLESTQPAIAYSDLPFMTALLTGIGRALFGESALAVRSLFLLLGASVPFLVYWLARPLTDHRQAVMSAGLSLCLPLLAMMGMVAGPDMPLIVLGILATGLMERALRLGDTRFWVLSGLVIALGLCTHYRFILFPAAGGLYLLFTRHGREQLKTIKPWLTVGLALPGLIPILWYNLTQDLSGVSYHFVSRHPWSFSAEGLLQPLFQAGMVGPLLYVLLIATLVQAWQNPPGPSTRLLLLVASLHIAGFALLAPVADQTRTSFHWPLSGYIPLLVLAPGMLLAARHQLRARGKSGWTVMLAWIVPVAGLAQLLIFLVYFSAPIFIDRLHGVLPVGTVSTKMTGWQEYSDFLDSNYSRWFSGPTEVVTDNYYLAAQTRFSGVVTGAIYTLDKDKAIDDGRDKELYLWQMDWRAWEKDRPDRALLIIEDSTSNPWEKFELLRDQCAAGYDLSRLSRLSLYRGAKVFSFYRLSRQPSASRCELSPLGALEGLDKRARVSGMVELGGWAFWPGNPQQAIRFLIDGVEIEAQVRAGQRPDIAEQWFGAYADNQKTGFSASIDFSGASPGRHLLELQAGDGEGNWETVADRKIRIQ